jgi:hypothetical protein
MFQNCLLISKSLVRILDHLLLKVAHHASILTAGDSAAWAGDVDGKSLISTLASNSLSSSAARDGMTKRRQ